MDPIPIRSYAKREVTRAALALLKKTVRVCDDDNGGRDMESPKVMAMKDTLPLVFHEPGAAWIEAWEHVVINASTRLNKDAIMPDEFEGSDEGRMDIDS